MKNAISAPNACRFGVFALALALGACSQDAQPPADTGSGETAQPAAGTGEIHNAPGTDGGTWGYLGGDAWHTRYSPADQITLDWMDFEKDPDALLNLRSQIADSLTGAN